MTLFKRIITVVSLLFFVCSLAPTALFAQQTGLTKPPSVNCPVSVYDQARTIKSASSNFGNLQNFNTFFSLYRKFTSVHSATGGESYYVIKWNVPTNVGWAVEYYERAYMMPVFPNNAGTPTQVYPTNGGQTLPVSFSLTKQELDALNAIHLQVPSVADKLIADMWMLHFFETECGTSIDINNIPANPYEIGLSGYGKTRANSQSFAIELEPDLWTRTDAASFTVAGEITALKEVAPSLKVAYGATKNNLNFLAPSGALFFNSPLAMRDVVKIPPLKINISHLSKDIKDNKIYFAIVDSKNTDLSYTDTQEVSLGGNSGLGYAPPSSPTQSAPGVSASQSGGIAEGICDGPTCGFNDLLKLFKNFWKFILILVVPIIAIMTAWIGFNFMQSGSEYKEKAKEMTWSMVKGLALIIFAWFIVKTILDFTVGKDSCYSFLGSGKIDAECVEKSK